MELVINLKIPDQLVREMNVYRKKYHPSKLSHSQAHITLVPPFILRGKLEDLTDDIARNIKSLRPFMMNINGLGSFNDDVIFFKPNCPSELRTLRESLRHYVWKNYCQKRLSKRHWRFKVYRPHVTIVADKPENIRKYKEELMGLKYKRRFRVIGVDLCVRRQDKKWIFKKEFLFGRAV